MIERREDGTTKEYSSNENNMKKEEGEEGERKANHKKRE